MREKVASLMILGLAIGMVGAGGVLPQAQAASPDTTSPAGTVTGAIVVFSPAFLLLTPAPVTGSLVVPLSVPPIWGGGPSMTQFQLVIPGPNPAQNTSISLAQLLSAVLASMQPSGHQGPPAAGTSAPALVSVFSTSSR